MPWVHYQLKVHPEGCKPSLLSQVKKPCAAPSRIAKLKSLLRRKMKSFPQQSHETYGDEYDPSTQRLECASE